MFGGQNPGTELSRQLGPSGANWSAEQFKAYQHFLFQYYPDVITRNKNIWEEGANWNASKWNDAYQYYLSQGYPPGLPLTDTLVPSIAMPGSDFTGRSGNNGIIMPEGIREIKERSKVTDNNAQAEIVANIARTRRNGMLFTGGLVVLLVYLFNR
jgi:hypothetical protein